MEGRKRFLLRVLTAIPLVLAVVWVVGVQGRKALQNLTWIVMSAALFEYSLMVFNDKIESLVVGGMGSTLFFACSRFGNVYAGSA